ncbi:MAG: hypothetical protein CVT49_09045 [candidate division Zixibacteria bacterium HGW-Zixibacteria-1]|nr:MAG: hypothetical protein CVT49_09045 [candidate division Zixibacteria bacterium HGW-Zixibacteria-1]
MFIWCAIMFFLGIAAFMDSLFNYGEIFRQINSVLFLLISLGVLIRTTIKMKAAKMENYESRIENLEMQLRAMKSEIQRETELEEAEY